MTSLDRITRLKALQAWQKESREQRGNFTDQELAEMECKFREAASYQRGYEAGFKAGEAHEGEPESWWGEE